MWQFFLLCAGCIPVVVLLITVSFERWLRKHKGERSPLSVKLLRPAGYSLQRKLEDLNDTYAFWLMGTFLCSLLAVGGMRFTSNDSRGMFLIIFGLSAAGSTVMAWRTLLGIRSYRR